MFQLAIEEYDQATIDLTASVVANEQSPWTILINRLYAHKRLRTTNFWNGCRHRTGICLQYRIYETYSAQPHNLFGNLSGGGKLYLYIL